MNCLNQITLIGRVVATPKFTVSKDGRRFFRFSLAVDRAIAGSMQKVSDFFSIKILGVLIDEAVVAVDQGRVVAVSGFLANQGYEDGGGGKFFRTEVVAERFWLLDFG